VIPSPIDYDHRYSSPAENGDYRWRLYSPNPNPTAIPNPNPKT